MSIVACPKCGSHYNNETVSYCPMCEQRHWSKDDQLHFEVESFIRETQVNCRRMNRGSHCKMKTSKQ